MATKARALRLEPAQRRRQGRLRFAFVGVCRALDRRPHWSFDNAARDEPRGRFDWDDLQERIALAIDAGADWPDVERFYLELMADARQHYEERRGTQPVVERELYIAAVREQCEAVAAINEALVAGGEAARERAIHETQESVEAGQRYVLAMTQGQVRIQPLGLAG